VNYYNIFLIFKLRKWNGPRAVEAGDWDKMGYMGDSEVTAQVERIRR